MQADALYEIQKRGRFLLKRSPGTKASDDWQRHRDQLQRRSPRLIVNIEIFS